MKEKISIKNIHISIIIIGIIFNLICVFHSNLWFDEAYSVGIANKSFLDIWRIGGNDVHPVLYYWILHIICLISNGSIVAYRIFSAICISVLGILGYTHIKKDFGEKIGLLFSFGSFFLPTMCLYATEIRMYSLAIVLVTVLAIYGYRIFKEDTKKNWIIFEITSLMCLYVHYYGLMAAGIINIILLIYLIKEKRKNAIIKIISFGILQLIAYIPWIMCLLKQMKHVSSGFWIGFIFPKTLIELTSFQFIGNMENGPEIKVGFIVSILIYMYLIYKVIISYKNKENIKPGILAISIYLIVIISALIVTKILNTSILYYRYLFVITGLYIFFISYFLEKEKRKYIIGIIASITLVLALWSNVVQFKESYSKTNKEPIQYLKENVRADDVFVFEEMNFGTGSIVALNFTDNTQYYYNPSNWGVAEAYEAFGKQLHVCLDDSFLKECKGRIWIVDNDNFDFYNKAFNNDNYKLIEKKTIKTKYEGYTYNFILVERVNEYSIGEYQGNDQNTSSNVENEKDSNTNQDNPNSQYKKEYILDEINIKFVPVEDMIILSDEAVDTYMGEGRSNIYDIVAMNSKGTKILYCFTLQGNKIKEYTAEQYIKESLKETDYGEIKNETIAGINFSVAELSYNEEGGTYIEKCYVYKHNEKCICFDYWYSAEEKDEFSQMLKRIE